jgi:hypothetical protein
MKRQRMWAAAAAAMTTLQAMAADALPRVFYTPQERADIVQQRSAVSRLPPGAAAPAPTTVALAAAENTAPVSTQVATPVLRLEGLSVSSSGTTYAWIGGQRYANGARLAGHRLDISAQGLVLVDASGRSRPIRVGEAINDPARAAGTKP